MTNSSAGAKQYFDSVPAEWDALYSHENRFQYAFNRIFRKGLYDRYRLTFEKVGDVTGKSVLDVGCGTGRFAIEFARRGASRVVGIDIAPSMIDFSKRVAGEMGVADKCEFILGDFLSVPLDAHYDIVAAEGFFDYIADPLPVFKRIAELKPRYFLASFPKNTLVWGTQRKIRYYYIKKCPIFGYTDETLTKLYTEAGFPKFEIIPIGGGMGGHGYFGIGSF